MSFFLEVPARFENLNADVRWTSACRHRAGGNTLNFLSNGKKIVPNLAGTCPDKRYPKAYTNSKISRQLRFMKK